MRICVALFLPLFVVCCSFCTFHILVNPFTNTCSACRLTPSVSFPFLFPYQQTAALILGDDNFTFSLPFLESRHHHPNETVEVASCLPEDQIPNEYRPNYLALKAQGVAVHFSVNPAQLRNHFFNNQFSRVVFILPGIAFSGFPDFLDKKADPLFRLRLHMYMFGFLKSSRNALKDDALVQIVWPRQELERPADLPQWVPWHGMDLAKIGELQKSNGSGFFSIRFVVCGFLHFILALSFSIKRVRSLWMRSCCILDIFFVFCFCSFAIVCFI